MKIPFLNRPETRAGYTDAIVEALLKQATGSTTASVSSLGVTEACAGLWGRSFARCNGYAVHSGYQCPHPCGPRDHRAAAAAVR